MQCGVASYLGALGQKTGKQTIAYLFIFHGPCFRLLPREWKLSMPNIFQIFRKFFCTMSYSRVPNKRACTPYLILTKLPPCTLLFGCARLSISVNFCQIFRPNLDIFWQKLGIYSTLHTYLVFVKIPPCMLIRACTLIRDTRVRMQ